MRRTPTPTDDAGARDGPGAAELEVWPMRAPADGLPVEMQVDAIETRGIEWGGQLVRHLDLPPGTDFTPLFQGLPGGRCPCPHWGYVLSGSIVLRYEDGTEETTAAGEAYYWPGGHTGWTDEGVTFLEVSPAAELQPVLEHLAAQLAP
jgi:hypothetical protein